MAKQIVMEGFSLPNGITTEAGVREMQRKIGTTVDGVWGPKTQNAYDKFLVQQAKGWQNAPTSKRFASKGEVDYAKTIYGLSLGVGKSDAGSHVMAGYQTPAGVNTAADVKKLQTQLGVRADGIWGKETDGAYKKTLGDSQHSGRRRTVQTELTSGNPRSSYYEPAPAVLVNERPQQENNRVNYGATAGYGIQDNIQKAMEGTEELVKAGKVSYPEYKMFDAEHRLQYDKYIEDHAPAYALAEELLQTGKSEAYDPLSYFADLAMQEIQEKTAQYQALYRQYTNTVGGNLRISTAELAQAREEMLDAITAFSQIPILLTKETLRNPYAAKYAEELSIRVPQTEQEYARIKAAREALGKEVLSGSNQGRPERTLWANQVSYALEAKLQAYSFFAGFVNNKGFDLPEVFGNQYLRSRDYVTEKDLQLHYMTTPKAVKQANPGLYQTGEIVSVLTDWYGIAREVATELKNVVGEKALVMLLKRLGGKAATNELQSLSVNALDWILEKLSKRKKR